MSDALAANVPKSLQEKIIDCNCLSHGFRKFRELLDYYPTICLSVIKSLGRVYEHEERTKGMSDPERLSFHRKYSKPLMRKLHKYLKRQFNKKRVEPNSSLGKSIRYMLKHWEKLTRFLTVSGAPLDKDLASYYTSCEFLFDNTKKSSTHFENLPLLILVAKYFVGSSYRIVCMVLPYACVFIKP
jgi:transposase